MNNLFMKIFVFLSYICFSFSIHADNDSKSLLIEYLSKPFSIQDTISLWKLSYQYNEISVDSLMQNEPVWETKIKDDEVLWSVLEDYIDIHEKNKSDLYLMDSMKYDINYNTYIKKVNTIHHQATYFNRERNVKYIESLQNKHSWGQILLDSLDLTISSGFFAFGHIFGLEIVDHVFDLPKKYSINHSYYQNNYPYTYGSEYSRKNNLD